MTMKPALALAFGIASALALSTAQAEVYQWKDSAGRTMVSDTPPPGVAAKDARVIGERQPVAKSEKMDLYTFQFSKEPPAQIPVIIGDVVHNLRAALDILIGDVARVAGKSPKEMKFPFAPSKEHF